MAKAIKTNEKKCRKELLEEVDFDPCGRTYKVDMKKLKSQMMSALTCPKLLEKFVTGLFPQRQTIDNQTEHTDNPEVPSVTPQEQNESCYRVENSKPSELDGIPNIAVKVAKEKASKMFIRIYNRCLWKGTFLTR